MRRVTRPGGRLVVCEFSHPTWAPFRTVYLEYLMRALPADRARRLVLPDAYVYLAESIRAWPDQPGLADADRRRPAGRTPEWRNLSGGIVALHRATADPSGARIRARPRRAKCPGQAADSASAAGCWRTPDAGPARSG